MIVNTSTSICKHLAEIIGSIGANDEDSIEELNEEKRAVGLGLSRGQILPVRLPGTPLISIAVGCVLIRATVLWSIRNSQNRGTWCVLRIFHPTSRASLLLPYEGYSNGKDRPSSIKNMKESQDV